MEVQLRSTFITYQEAQRLIAFFKEAKQIAPLVEQRRLSRNLLDELEYVRDIDYSPLRGYQLELQPKEFQILKDTLAMLRERENTNGNLSFKTT